MAKRKSSTKISNRTHVFDAFHEEKICEIPITLAKYVDPMDRLRPKKNRAKEYNLDQKYALMDKGDVKVRYTDTDATYVWNPEGYVPPPPPKLERKERGRGPLEELLDETWRKVVDKQQMRIRAQNRIKFATTKRTKLRKFLIAQQSILEDTGPDWFQEMKTEQLEVVESLAGCIHYDLQRKSICKTLEAMARLGLVPRPRPVNIKIALDSCCASPVEFLLILYHISNAKRASYSINDRLLLSAVVHLTIKDTFKELHVRIPSPPPVPKVPLKPRTPPQRIPCRSPYLDTFIHQPPMPKRNWEKPDREYPRSEFFSYLDELVNIHS